MDRVFITEYRIPRAKPSGAPGFIHVKAGDTPEQYGLDPADCVGLLTEQSPGMDAPPEENIDEVTDDE